MEIQLSELEKKILSKQHKKARDKRVADRIKAVLLSDEGWSQEDIAQALRIRPETVHDHLKDYVEEKKLKPENGGSQSKLSGSQANELIAHIEANTYMKVKNICSYVKSKYDVKYTVAGMTAWLHAHKFSYKKPKATPAKADPEKQAEFIKKYEELRDTRPKDEPIVFGDASHPTMATKVTAGWIRTGKDKLIDSIASRTRVNIVGAINLETMALVTHSYETVNSESMVIFLKALKEAYPDAPRIHFVLDQGPYNISAITKKAAEEYGIILHYLPTYSPNLNPIERLWKLLSDMVRNNKVFSSAKEFRDSIFEFFAELWPKISHESRSLINDNFQRINRTSSI